MKRLYTIAFVTFLLTAIGGEAWVEWDRVPEPVSGYLVRYGPSSSSKLVNQFVGDTNMVRILGVPDNIQVFMDVRAIGTNGIAGPPSNELVISTNRVSAPANLRSVTNVTKWELIATNIFYWRQVEP